ncbi:MAG TPA: calcium-binding protein [Patescibacteria group bacterium]|nr:calcium-binding protein [Patescibacteria group bacterium]
MASIVGTGANDPTLVGTQGVDDVQGKGGNDWIQTLGGNDTLIGGNGSDALWAGSGADTMIGSDGVPSIDLVGNDTYHVDNIGDIIIEFSGEGTDRVHSYISYDMHDALEVENLRLVGFAAGIDAIGNDHDNTMEGNRERNTLAGGLGDDSYIIYNETDLSKTDLIIENAGEGSDTYRVGFTFALGATTLNIENITLTGTKLINATGNDGDNILTGNVAKNTLTGGDGNDTYVVQSLDDVLRENAAQGNDTVSAAFSYSIEKLIYLENIVLTGTAPANAVGNASVNILQGNDAVNTLDGRAGADIMSGGKNGDVYVVDNAADTANEVAGQGVDLVLSSVTYTLSAEIENLTLTGSGNITGTGNVLDNTITGNASVNTLIGGIGDDVYVVQNGGDVILEVSGEGEEKINSSVSYNMGTNATEVENMVLTGTSAINGAGNALVNTITGNTATNVISGGAGDDTLFGGNGNDTLFGDADNDSLDGGLGNDIISGGDGNDIIEGQAGNDTINGNDGNDILNGRVGADTMTGGLGNDTFVVDDIKDVVIDLTNGGIDEVVSSISFSLAPVAGNHELENLSLGGNAIIGIGNELDNTITGNDVGNSLIGAAGIDTLIGNKGDDVYFVENAADVVTEYGIEGQDEIRSSVSYDMGASGEVESLVLTSGIAIFGWGNIENNTITGSGAVNTLYGRNGSDFYVMDNNVDVVVEVAGEGTLDTILASVTYFMAAAGPSYDVEALTLTGIEDINGTGNTAANTLTGNAGVNILTGGLGNDVYVVNDFDDINLDTFVEQVGQGSDTVAASISFALKSSAVYEIENVLLTGTDDINAGGNDLNNLLTGNVGNNSLNGSTGVDTMVGVGGDDTYFIDVPGDIVTEQLGEGNDTINVSFTYSLTTDVQNVENLTLTGALAIDGEGNADVNIITGNINVNTLTGLDGNDTINGGAGADVMIGGLDDDHYVVDNASDIVSELAGEGADSVETLISYDMSVNATGEVETLQLLGSLNVNGTGNATGNTIIGNTGANTISGLAGDDTLYGMAGDDQLFGGANDDTLDGGIGIDMLAGGTGDDVYIITSAAKTVIEASGEGVDEVRSSLTHTLALHVDNLTLTGGNPVNGFGNDLANLLKGNGAVNTLDGSTGVDTLIGDGGSDVFIVDDAMDIVTEGGGGGTADTILSSVTYDMGVSATGEVENLVLTGAASINGFGNAEDNTITGNSGVNTMDGGMGDDAHVVQSLSDVVLGAVGEGEDSILSAISWALNNVEEVENIFLLGTSDISATGNDLGNSLIGNSGKNILDGGLGDDTYGLGASATNDTIVLDTGGNDTVIVGASFTIASRADLENIWLTGTSAINATGNASANTLLGNDGKNILNGGTGADFMVGGLGDDLFYVDNVGDITLDKLIRLPDEPNINAGGKDTVISTVSYGLSVDLENLTLVNVATALNGSGNNNVNIIKGNTYDNFLNGGGGADTMDGGAGNDSYGIDTISDVIKDSAGIDTVYSSLASTTLGRGLENLTLTALSDADGTGNTGNNILTGNGFDNVLNGAKGNDTFIGGGGDDIYIVDSVTDVVIGGADTDTIQSSVTWSIAANAPIENLTLTGKNAIHGTGNAGDNTIIGNDGANTLMGGDGNDFLAGGAGLDILIGGNGSDTFHFAGATAFKSVDKVLDFHFGEDVISFDAPLDPLLQVNEDFLEFVVSGSNVNIYLDYDAQGEAYSPQLIAILINPT